MSNMDIAHQLSMALAADLSPFDDIPFMTSDLGPHEVAAFALRGSLLKKWEPDGVSKSAEAAAFSKFEEVNGRMLNWSLRLETLQDEYLYGMFVQELHELLGWRIDDECDFSAVADGIGFGPGAVVGADSSTFHKKVFESTLTATSDWLITLYRAAVSRSPTWAVAERRRDEVYGFKIVEGCRLFFVPKYAHIARTCSTQPAVNMTLQKGIDSFILRRLRESWGINPSAQPDLNREMARTGSIDGDMCTIDLSSASDCTSLALVKLVLPDPLKTWVLRTRTPVTTYQNRQIELGMVSMMGNGYTFSLETAIFAAVVRAVYKLVGLPLRVGRSNDFGVFGDDICVRRKAYSGVVRLLGLLGYEVNGDKSFRDGLFRESCGADYWDGYPVRGVYLRRLRTDADVYSAVNRLNRWSAIHGIPLTCTVQLLVGLLRGKPFRVPPSEQDDAGLKVPFDATRPRVDDCYNFVYHKLQSSPKRWFPRYDTEGSLEPSYGVAILGGYLGGPERHLTDNSSSWESNQFVGNRREPIGVTRRMKVVRDRIPWWDWFPRDVFRGISYGGWKSAVVGNLLL